MSQDPNQPGQDSNQQPPESTPQPQPEASATPPADQQPPQIPPASSTEPTPSTGTANATTGEPVPDAKDVENNKVYAILSYIGILWLVPLLAAKDSPFAKYHANQGLLLFIGGMGASILVGCGTFVASIALWFLGCCGQIVSLLVLLAWVAFAIMGIINAANGQMKPLPGLGTIKIIK